MARTTTVGKNIHSLIAKGEADINARRTIRYSSSLMAEISQKGKEAALKGKRVKCEVR